VARDVQLPWSPGAWRRLLADAVDDTDRLRHELGLESPAGDEDGSEEAARQFKVRVPRGFVDGMRRGDETDPLLRQVLPTAAELEEIAGFTTDPIGEQRSKAVDGVLHKYHGRALLVVTGACAIHCRYCFRRHFPYSDATALVAGWEAAVDRIADDDSLREVILSGGDPLTLTDGPLDELFARLAAIPHLRRLRVHTRVPVVLPERVDHGLLEVLGKLSLPLVVVLHVNHGREVDQRARIAIAALRDLGAMVLNQAVLLAGINDTVEAQRDLHETLFEAGVLPYYLHLLDPVAGAAHFDVPEDQARQLMAEVAAILPGYLVPRLVREIEGAPAKVVLAPSLP
jgi:EF-P beta-lysylation protein EpmB